MVGGSASAARSSSSRIIGTLSGRNTVWNQPVAGLSRWPVNSDGYARRPAAITSGAHSMCVVSGSGARLTPDIGGKQNRAHKPLKQLMLKRLTLGKILVTYPAMNRVRYKILAFCKHLSSLGLSP